MDHGVRRYDGASQARLTHLVDEADERLLAAPEVGERILFEFHFFEGLRGPELVERDQAIACAATRTAWSSRRCVCSWTSDSAFQALLAIAWSAPG